ncbi:flavodoxins [Bellilinea caldifistulae]|uniref:Flavodoxin-like domain-containing protein n=1 Tax=Bellilinea caldifistulae TaxID=360411 RepID=A0A0P6XSI6_9CHLR|nr:flavodoxin family protein [Bellilinea caldifistulae]KPL78126.1 hypothetical protein AC812_01495 [Bellilinea caldifistulae]GAP09222.1 flavodoxins [Bellilinea caldifistulae]
MQILIVYDSFFGNTEQIARQIGEALDKTHKVETVRAGDATAEMTTAAELLIVGSPTRGFRPSEDTARFLDLFGRGSLDGKKVAAFDTRIPVETIQSGLLRFIVNKGGYAAPAIAKKLERSGARLIAPPEGFFVNGTEGPLKEGELERAAAWARSLISG